MIRSKSRLVSLRLKRAYETWKLRVIRKYQIEHAKPFFQTYFPYILMGIMIIELGVIIYGKCKSRNEVAKDTTYS